MSCAFIDQLIFIFVADKWKNHRRLINTSFNTQILQTYLPEINRVSNHLIEQLSTDQVSQPNLLHLIGHSITDIQTSTLFGHRFTDEENLRIFNLVEATMKFWDERMLHMFDTLVWKMLNQTFGIPSEERQFYDKLADLLRPAFETSREKYLSDQIGDGKSDYFLKRLTRIRDQGHIDEKEFKGHTLNALLAGTDTSTIATCNILLCLAMNPAVQEDLHTELNDVLGEDFEAIGYDDLSKLPLLDRVCKESLRMLPVVSMIGRNISQDIMLERGLLRAGTDTIVPIVAIHRSKFIWGDEADTFNPENFLSENVEKRHSCSYVPFGYGPRNCLGYKFAMIFIRILVAQLVKKFKFTTKLEIDALKFNFRVTSTLLNGYMIDVEKRA